MKLFKTTSMDNYPGHIALALKIAPAIILRRGLFAEKVVNVWNCLPQCLRANYSTLAIFRRCIEVVDFKSFLKCDTDKSVYMYYMTTVSAMCTCCPARHLCDLLIHVFIALL